MKQQLSQLGGVFIFAIVIALWGINSAYYTVEPDEEAVVLRFGKYLDTHPPGLHFKLPFGIDKSFVIKTQYLHQEEFGFRTVSSSGTRSKYSSRNYDKESIMLTGDLNVADVEWVVQYQIADPFNYLFAAKDPVLNLRDVSESILRRVVGDRSVTNVLTTGRSDIAIEAKQYMQETLEKFKMGILIKSIKLQDVNPPDAVKASFNEVNEAKQEQEKLINEAEKEYNQIIPEAKGKAEETIARAEGYSVSLIERAHGDANRFNDQVRAYAKAPSVTRKRLYIEAMEEVFKRFTELTIVDPKIKGVLPVFNKELGVK